MYNTVTNTPSEIQQIERRSISFPLVAKHKPYGILSLPRQKVDISVLQKTDNEKKQLSKLKAELMPPIGQKFTNKLN